MDMKKRPKTYFFVRDRGINGVIFAIMEGCSNAVLPRFFELI
jgi:hypothetical protein